MATNNSTILGKVWLNASNDFQQRIPNPTQGNISKTVGALFDPMNRSYFNDFMNVLINRIAFTYVHSKVWDNKLAVFKKQKINYGSTIQEVAPKWIKAHSYNVSDETLLKLARPEAGVWYHSQNRQDRYDISISYDDLRTAFVEEYGLNNFIAAIMETPINSDNYDEYRIMLQLVAEYDGHFGFFKKQVTAPTDTDSAKAFLKTLRADAQLMTFPSARYNALNVDIPVFINDPSSLVLLITPEYLASLDVDALAVLFNLEKAEVQQRIIPVDEFPVPNAVALLTTEDYFVCHDTVYENTSFWNAQTLSTNYYLHHWGVYSVSPFVPAILYTTSAGTSIPVVTQSITALSMTPATATVKAGRTQQLTLALTGTVSSNPSDNVPESVVVSPAAATFTITGVASSANDAAAIDIPETVYVDRLGVLHTKGLTAGNVITITAKCTYMNPSGSTSSYTDTTVVTIS